MWGQIDKSNETKKNKQTEVRLEKEGAVRSYTRPWPAICIVSPIAFLVSSHSTPSNPTLLWSRLTVNRLLTSSTTLLLLLPASCPPIEARCANPSSFTPMGTVGEGFPEAILSLRRVRK